MAVQFES